MPILHKKDGYLYALAIVETKTIIAYECMIEAMAKDLNSSLQSNHSELRWFKIAGIATQVKLKY